MDWSRMYQGFLATPLLWEGSLGGLLQLELPAIPPPKLLRPPSAAVRLGVLAEHFTFDYWSNFPDLQIFEHNLQIQGKVETLGELDAIVSLKEQWLHVEIAYKIYLFDPRHGNNQLEHWIGPNRDDRLTEKLHRLQQHQLPLIQHPEAKQTLTGKGIPTENLTSKTYVKGLLFTPENTEVEIAPLNPACLTGTYMKFNRFKTFQNMKFFLPHKLEWMVLPHTNVSWKSMQEIIPLVQGLHEKNYSPMLWVKKTNGELSRIFVTWW